MAYTYTIKNAIALRKILRADVLLGGGTAFIGLLFFSSLAPFLGLTASFIVIVSSITLLYACVAIRLATQESISIPLLRTLIYANWVWTAISIVLFFTHVHTATIFGIIFLVLQIFVVGGLAYLEGNQLAKKSS